MRRFLTALLLGAALIGGATTPVSAAPTAKKPAYKKVIKQCTKGKVKKGYSVRTLKKAKRKLTPDVREYTKCEQQINKAIKKARKKR